MKVYMLSLNLSTMLETELSKQLVQLLLHSAQQVLVLVDYNQNNPTCDPFSGINKDLIIGPKSLFLAGICCKFGLE